MVGTDSSTPDAQFLAETHELAHRFRLAAEISRNDERTFGAGQRCGDFGRRRLRQGSGRQRSPMVGVDGDGFDFLLHHLSRAGKIDGPLRIAMCKLHRAIHQLRHVLASAEFVGIFHIAANDTALVGDVLNPLYEFIAAAAHLALLREG